MHINLTRPNRREMRWDWNETNSGAKRTVRLANPKQIIIIAIAKKRHKLCWSSRKTQLEGCASVKRLLRWNFAKGMGWWTIWWRRGLNSRRKWYGHAENSKVCWQDKSGRRKSNWYAINAFLTSTDFPGKYFAFHRVTTPPPCTAMVYIMKSAEIHSLYMLNWYFFLNLQFVSFHFNTGGEEAGSGCWAKGQTSHRNWTAPCGDSST